jgi:NAD(P)-dependent dehydrogenase (short-subunit alcohol dehydrogenase family)
MCVSKDPRTLRDAGSGAWNSRQSVPTGPFPCNKSPWTQRPDFQFRMNSNLQYVLMNIKYRAEIYALHKSVALNSIQPRSRETGIMQDRKPLAGKVALVTGGSRGVGTEIGRRLAADGAHVVLAARSREAGERAAGRIASAGDSVEFRELDVTDEARWQELAASIVAGRGALHILVNNAGVHQLRGFAATCRDDFDRLVQTNLLGPYLGMKTCLPHLAAAGRRDNPARIVNISSVVALAPTGRQALYNMTKAGLDSMTKSVAREVAHDQLPVTANTVNPGIVETDMGADLVRQLVAENVFDDEASAVRYLKREYPVRRFAQSGDVAAAVAFLCSAETHYITGISLPVDGGLTCH